MSNYLAIATVTAALQQIVQATAKKVVGGADVDVGRPNMAANPGVLHKIYLYLYQVSPNAALRNTDLPNRDSQGRLAQRSQAALDLHYLLAFYGDESALETQRMLGAVVRDLHAHPILARQDIKNAIANYPDLLMDTDLANAIESVKFTLLSLSLDELSKLWSVFFQTPHALSIVYRASVVLIEAEESPIAALPVRQPGVYGLPFTPPLIERVRAEAAAGAPEVPGLLEPPIDMKSTLIIEGKRLQGEDTSVLIDGEGINSQNVEVTDTKISVALNALGLRCGAHSIQVVHCLRLGTQQLHKIVQSNAVPFLLRPVIQVPSNAANSLVVTFMPAVGKMQRVTLLLFEITERSDPPPRSYLINAPKDNGIVIEGKKETESIIFAIEVVKDGNYLARARVDGAESVLVTDATGQYIQPKVTKP